jgi:hypothetical protein
MGMITSPTAVYAIGAVILLLTIVVALLVARRDRYAG